ncbi:unnamed protein product [Rotaria socialis]|uniref:Uncharacterized protein n=1 Tax=Rotaria socialis TaxID=392032 RepID=A0A817Q9Z1_9BILA|nr:unnamed protein product [Rotaria socialis]CAF3356236.1 unnamed protein product [Rotaria socialis]CAF4546516.1 unnamed protein product [Rotaria socialis]CAF4576924.1 unnamed protein product [Rotaria socialis]
MPPKSKRQKQAQAVLLDRYKICKKNQLLSEEDSFDAIIMTMKDDEKCYNSTTSSDDNDASTIDVPDFKSRLDVHSIADIFELCNVECGSRKISTLLYMTLRYLGHKWRNIDLFLRSVGGYTCQVAHGYAEIFLNGDISELESEKRGGKRFDSFYDLFPELEDEAKSFAIESCAKKSADFTTHDLAKYIDTRYYDVTGTTKTNDALIRSSESCRLDLRRWGARFLPNSQRPYFEGHERDDIVKHRSEFVSYFLTRKDRYYTISDDEQPKWNIPKQKPCVLIFHDESTFKSGEVSAKRWVVDGRTPFFSKGSGRSHMISDFLVQHPSGPFFSLSKKEYEEAVKRYPTLLTNSSSFTYDDYSARSGINVGQQGYFDNETILAQFERLFQLLHFKKHFKNHEIEVVVDNARTHSAREYSIIDFGKKIGTRCPVDTIEYIDNKGNNVSISCYFDSGLHKGKSKGLLQLAKELHVHVDPTIKLLELRKILSDHPAFQNVSKLENLGRKYNIKVIFVPKFHCELNPIEGVWCYMKQYVRKMTDQTFPTMMRLIPESQDNFVTKQVHLKLFRRFWQSLDAYQQGKSYGDVLKLFFSGRCNSTIISHRKITNSAIS